jgi:hypothetical protein
MNVRGRRVVWVLVLVFLSGYSFAQDSVSNPNKYIYFPHPIPAKSWTTSLGLTFAPMPQDVTSQVQVKAPAGDFHALYGLGSGFYLDGRLNFQILQNQVSAGLRWAHPINEKFSWSVGDDIAYWAGRNAQSTFTTKGSGIMNYPNISIGLRVNPDMLLTLKTEAFVVLSATSTISGTTVLDQKASFAGGAGQLSLEQPLYGKKSITLGARIMYTNFFWQTWPSNDSYNRRMIFPEIVTGFIF